MTTNPQYGIVERKNAEIEALKNQVADTQYKVDQYQAIANALKKKAEHFQEYLTAAESNKATALTDKNAVEQAVGNIRALKERVGTVLNQAGAAKVKTDRVAMELKTVVDQLMMSIEMIDKLSGLVNRAKRINPLISDNVIAMLAKAGTDANTAFGLTVTALNASFTTKEWSAQTERTAVLDTMQAENLQELITQTGDGDTGEKTGLKKLLEDRYQERLEIYDHALTSNDRVTKQLAIAEDELDKATVTLNSLKAGLDAAKAAAMAA